MRQGSTPVTTILVTALLAGCGGTPGAWGEVNSLIVATSPEQWEAIGEMVETAVETRVLTVRPEKTFRVTYQDPAGMQWGMLQRFRQLLLVGPPDSPWMAEALARAGTQVRMGHPRPEGADPHGEHNGVMYYRRADFQPQARRDVLLSYREPKLWLQPGLRPGGVNIHWSVDVEPPWRPEAVALLDHYVCLTHWARARQVWVPESLARVIPYGIDTALLDAQRREQEPGLALYCASPDRGLETLLEDWPKILEHRPETRLNVAYGWRLFDGYTRGSPAAVAFKRKMEKLLKQDGVRWLGELSRAEIAAEYWRAQYWVHPLNRPDSELFCLNALKARHCEAIPVVNPVGALAETAPPFIPYERWIAGGEAIVETLGQNEPPTLQWDQIVERYWKPLFEKKSEEAA